MSSWSYVKRFRLLHQRLASIIVFHIVTSVALAAAVLMKFAQWLAGADEPMMPHLSAIISPIHLLLLVVVLLTVTAAIYIALRPRTVYLVDYACFRPSYNTRCPKATFIEHARLSPILTDSTVN